MLTTAADARWAASRRLPGGMAVGEAGGASTSDTPLLIVNVPARPTHSGLSVATTKYAASRTVTACEKSSQ